MPSAWLIYHDIFIIRFFVLMHSQD